MIRQMPPILRATDGRRANGHLGHVVRPPLFTGRACGWPGGFLLLLAMFLPVAAQAGEPQGVNWPSFRGPRAKGIAEGFPTPTTWAAESSENIKWKKRIPGLGHSSPVIWGDRVFVTTAISGRADPELKVGLYGDPGSVDDDTVHRWLVYALDKEMGKTLWKQTACKGIPQVKRHTKATQANCTPATNGKRVVVFFGSEGLYCYDMKGKLKWKKDLGVLDASPPRLFWGFASSPIIHGQRVYIQCDTKNESFVAALKLSDGSEIWRTTRDEPATWSTPTIYKKGPKTLLLCNGYQHIGGYDAQTGEELWKLHGGGDAPVPTPVVGRGLVFITNAHGRSSPLYAINLSAQGDITLQGDATSNDHVAWSTPRNGAYMQTPLLYGDYLYSCSDRGVLKCYRAKTGELVYRHRLGGGGTGFTASPVAANDQLYFTSEEGDVYVVQTGPEFKILAENQMGEVCMATPAISEGVLFFRTRDHLVAVEKPSGKAAKTRED